MTGFETLTSQKYSRHLDFIEYVQQSRNESKIIIEQERTERRRHLDTHSLQRRRQKASSFQLKSEKMRRSKTGELFWKFTCGWLFSLICNYRYYSFDRGLSKSTVGQRYLSRIIRQFIHSDLSVANYSSRVILTIYPSNYPSRFIRHDLSV